MSMNYSIILGNLGNTCDRFLSSGYKEELDKDTMLKQASQINRVKGIELVGTWDIDEKNVREMRLKFDDLDLNCVSIIPDLFSQKKWGNGSFSSADSSIRRAAVEEVNICTDMAVEMNCDLLNIWPGQDGYDYPLQSYYTEQRHWMTAGLQTVCRQYPDIRFALEYKVKEPRTHSFLARCADTLLIAKEINLPNVGLTIDVGHSWVAYENVAEAVVMLNMYGEKLFHIHFNDNYGFWDDDMIVGAVHLVEYLELLFWLKETGYTGWYSMDQYPYRENAQAALRESIEFLKGIDRLLTADAMGELREIIKKGDATRSTAWIIA